MVLVTQVYLLTWDLQPGLYCNGKKQVSASDTQDCKGFPWRKRGVFCGEDQSLRVWKISVDLCGCTSLRPLFWVRSLSDYSAWVNWPFKNVLFHLAKHTKIREGMIKTGFWKVRTYSVSFSKHSFHSGPCLEVCWAGMCSVMWASALTSFRIDGLPLLQWF